MNIDATNFQEKYPEIKLNIQRSEFIAIDVEYTGTVSSLTRRPQHPREDAKLPIRLHRRHLPKAKARLDELHAAPDRDLLLLQEPADAEVRRRALQLLHLQRAEPEVLRLAGGHPRLTFRTHACDSWRTKDWTLRESSALDW
jgi:hypothetical protein